MKHANTPLWIWIGLRMSLLAVSAVVLIAVSMRVYILGEDRDHELQLPVPVREELHALSSDPRHNADRIWQIYREHYDIEDFMPGLPSKDWWMLARMVGIAIPFIIVAGLFGSRSLSRQFTVYGEAARKVRDGDFSVHLDTVPRAPQELSDLTANFNDMARRLAQYERELTESSAMLAHELRTPLNAAMGRLQAMLDEVFPMEPAQLYKVHALLEQINRLVGDMHLVSLARAGQLALEFDWFAIDDLVAERIEWSALAIRDAGMAVRIDCDKRLVMEGDRDRIGQCLSILIGNALRYAADGKVLEATVRRRGDYVHVAVGDRGPGVDDSALTRLVDRFWRAEDSRSRHLGGSGLGLAISAAICQAHGGKLECANRAGGGLEVTLVLPLAHKPAPTSR